MNEVFQEVLREEKDIIRSEFEALLSGAGGDLVILKEKMIEEKTLALAAAEADKELHLEGIRAQFEVEKDILISNVRSEMEKEEKLSRKLEEVVMEKCIEDLRIIMRSQIEEQAQMKDKESDERIEGMMNEQAVMMEADRARSLKLESSKWKQAMKEAEKRLALEVKQAKLEAREERDQELQLEMVEIRSEWDEKTKKSLQVAENESKLLIERLVREHAERISQLESQLIGEGEAMAKENHDLQVKNTVEKEEAILQAQTVLRISLKEEFDSRLKVFIIIINFLNMIIIFPVPYVSC
jgi:hypothetical protein